MKKLLKNYEAKITKKFFTHVNGKNFQKSLPKITEKVHQTLFIKYETATENSSKSSSTNFSKNPSQHPLLDEEKKSI
jgi:hypothetical protein